MSVINRGMMAWVLVVLLAVEGVSWAGEAPDGLDAAAGVVSDWNASPDKRNEAVARLRAGGSKSFEQVRRLLKSPVWMARREGLTLAKDVKLPELGAALSAGLQDRNWAVRAQAAALAGSVPEELRPQVEGALKGALGDPLAEVRLKAYQSWAATHPNSEVLVRGLKDKDRGIAFWAAQKLVEDVQPEKLTAEQRTQLIEAFANHLQESLYWTETEGGLVHTMVSLGPGATDALFGLVTAMNGDQQGRAINLIGTKCGSRCLELMFRLARDGDAGVQARAMAQVWSYCQASDVPRLLEMEKGDCLSSEAVGMLRRLRYKAAVPRLVDSARKCEEDDRVLIYETLADIGDKSAVPGLLEVYHSRTNDRERAALVQPLARLMGADARGFLAEAVRSYDVQVRMRALSAFEYLPKAQKESLLIEVLQDEEEDSVRLAAVKQLQSLDSEKVLNALAEVLKSGGTQSRLQAASVLTRQSPERAVKILMEACEREQDVYVQASLVGALGQLQRAEAVPLLRKLLTSDALEVRVAALNALGRFRQVFKPEEMMQVLARENEDEMLQLVMGMMANQRVSDVRSLPRLQEIATNAAKTETRVAAVMCIGTIDDPQASRVLCQLLKGEKDPAVQRVAMNAVVERIGNGKIRFEAFEKTLTGALESGDEGVRAALVRALAQTKDANLGPVLLKMVKDNPETVQWEALEGLGAIATPDMVPALAELARTENGRVKVALIGLLARFGDRQALPVIRDCMKSDDAAVQAAAIQAIGRFHDSSLVEFYVNQYQGSASREMKLSCLQNLKGTGDRRALGVALGAMRDEDARMRRLGAEVLLDFSDAETSEKLTQMVCDGAELDDLPGVAEAIGRVRLKKNGERLLEAGKRATDEGRAASLCAMLGWQRDRRAAGFVGELLRKSESEVVLGAGVEALVRLNGSAESAALVGLAERRPGTGLERAALAAAEKLGVGAPATGLAAARFRMGTDVQRRLYVSLAGGLSEADVRAAADTDDAGVLAGLCSATAPDSAGNVDWLKRMALSDLPAEVGVAAIRSLGRKAAAHRALFVEVLNSGRPARCRAEALRWVLATAPAAEAEGLLREQLGAGNPEMERVCLRFVAERPGRHEADVCAKVAALLESTEPGVHRAAIEAAGTLVGDAGAEKALLALMDRPRAYTPLPAVARALGGLKAEAALPKLGELVQSGSLEERAAAVEAIGAIGTTEAVKMVVGFWGNGDVDVIRAAAARALGKMGKAEYAGRLAEGLRSDVSFEVRAACAEALGGIGGDAAKTALRGALGSESGAVREAAVRALGRLGAGAEVQKLADDPDAGVAAAVKDVVDLAGGTR